MATGALATTSSFTTSSLVIGTHQITFRSKCSTGVWSDYQKVTVTVAAPDIVVAKINSITPNPAKIGDSVIFNGSGTDSLGHSIAGYEWTSPNGLLSTRASFTNSMIPEGTYNIYFRARCSSGTWSEPSTTTLIVGASTSSVASLTPTSTKNRLMAVSGNRIIFTVNAKDSVGTNLSGKTITATVSNVSPRAGTGDTVTPSATTDSSGNTQFTLSTTNINLGTLNVTFSAENGTVTKQVTITAVKKGDINGDSYVNMSDLSILMSNWGSSPTNIYADFYNGDGSGAVGLSELSVLMDSWGI